VELAFGEIEKAKNAPKCAAGNLVFALGDRSRQRPAVDDALEALKSCANLLARSERQCHAALPGLLRLRADELRHALR
jgi:hypothetical protein